MYYISIIVPAFHRINQTIQTIRCILSSDGNGTIFVPEIIVSDSTPDVSLRQAIQTAFGDAVRYVKPEQPGIATGKNRGAEAASHEILIFCDSDIEVEPGTIVRTLEALAKPTVAAVTANVIWRGGEKDGQTDIPHTNDRLHTRDGITYLEALYSRYMATYRTFFCEAGGYDSQVFNMRGEGSDLSIRYWRQGFPLTIDQTITVHHVFDAPDASALRIKNAHWGVVKDMLLLAYKYDMLDADCPNFANTVRTNLSKLGEMSHYAILQGIGQNLDFITMVKPIIDAQKQSMNPVYDFKFLEVFSDTKKLTMCLDDATQRLANYGVK